MEESLPQMVVEGYSTPMDSSKHKRMIIGI